MSRKYRVIVIRISSEVRDGMAVELKVQLLRWALANEGCTGRWLSNNPKIKLSVYRCFWDFYVLRFDFERLNKIHLVV